MKTAPGQLVGGLLKGGLLKCSLLGLFTLLGPSSVHAGDPSPQVLRDIGYAADGPHAETLLCDLYLPAASEDAPPVALLIHGGAWRSGDKWTISRYGEGLAERGIAAVVINYRLAPEHPFPAQIDDVRTAMIWTVEQAPKYGWDPSRIGMFGYSAGAHMACLIGTLADEPAATQHTTSDWPADDSRWSRLPQVTAIVAGGAPCDFRSLPLGNTVLAYFLGGSRAQQPQAYAAASPSQHASAGDVPTLFVHGKSDLIVPYQSSRGLFELQRQQGVRSEYLAIAGQGHLMTFINDQTPRAAYGFLQYHLTGQRHSESADRR